MLALPLPPYELCTLPESRASCACLHICWFYVVCERKWVSVYVRVCDVCEYPGELLCQ